MVLLLYSSVYSCSCHFAYYPVAVWSEVNVAGVRMREKNPNIGNAADPENWAKVHRDVVNSAYDVIRMKGYTSWAIGLSIADMASSLLRNASDVHAVSTFVEVSSTILSIWF